MKMDESESLKSRREFLSFLGRSSAAVALAPWLEGCTSAEKKGHPSGPGGLAFRPLTAGSKDDLTLADGFSADVIVRWNDIINDRGDRFGSHNDYIAFFRLNEAGTDGLLWVNHEYFQPLLVHGRPFQGLADPQRTEDVIARELSQVGGSILRVRKDESSGRWAYVTNDALNRRIDGTTELRLASSRPIAGRRTAMGTFANCAGGFTPWGTVLTCEEKVYHYYGDYEYDAKGGRKRKKSSYGWERFHDNPPEHYGWVVEIDPLTGKGKKLTALGRFEHECATVRPGPDGRCVVYMGDDDYDQCVYKFVADKPGSLETGTLYVANLEQKHWLPLTVRQNAELKRVFKDDTEVAIRARASARIAGGTPLGRPEDVEIDPKTGAVYVALTVRCDAGEKYGTILKLEEKNNDPFATEFTWSKFLSGGPETGFACPDNLAFDRVGNLWMCNEIGGNFLNQGEYKIYGNNSLFYIPLSGPNAGQAFRVASAPMDAELTGPCFSPDGRTLFLSVQHPGAGSKALDKLTSHWPDGGDSVPRSSVVAIAGPALDQLVAGTAVPPLFEAPVLKRG